MRSFLILTGCWLGTATALVWWLDRGERQPEKHVVVLDDTPALVAERLRNDALRADVWRLMGDLAERNAEATKLRVMLDAVRRDGVRVGPGADVRPEDLIPPPGVPVR